MTTTLAALPWPAATAILTAVLIAAWLATGLMLGLLAGVLLRNARELIRLRGADTLTYPELHEDKERVS